ncbi:MAG: hypothetical protein CMO55_11975 [Verrucomicrobiales bacterium]|nr:hypothetical protein [Verrucomicrobiales bacterium]
MSLRLSLLLSLVIVFLLSPTAFADSDAALLLRLKGTYFGREVATLRAPGFKTERSQFSTRYVLPNGRGVIRGYHRAIGGTGRARLVGRIRRVKCRGNRVIYQGVVRFRFRGRSLTARRFRAVATERANATAILTTTGTYKLRGIRINGAFRGQK